jgi:NADH-quinone oxidoreductase subunit E
MLLLKLTLNYLNEKIHNILMKDKLGDKILLNVLHEIQDKEGYLPEDSLKKISIKYQVPISRLYGMATFYTHFKIKKQGKHIIEICGSPSCTLNKSREIEQFIEKELKVGLGDTTEDKMFSIYKTSCIGLCDEAPAILIDGRPYTKLTVERVKDILNELKKKKIRRKNANTKGNKS